MKSKLAIGISLSGWFLLAAFLFYEKVEHGDEMVRHIFQPPSKDELILHVVIVILPFISTAIGFLINERKKLFEIVKRT